MWLIDSTCIIFGYCQRKDNQSFTHAQKRRLTFANRLFSVHYPGIVCRRLVASMPAHSCAVAHCAFCWYIYRQILLCLLSRNFIPASLEYQDPPDFPVPTTAPTLAAIPPTSLPTKNKGRNRSSTLVACIIECIEQFTPLLLLGCYILFHRAECRVGRSLSIFDFWFQMLDYQ